MDKVNAISSGPSVTMSRSDTTGGVWPDKLILQFCTVGQKIIRLGVAANAVGVLGTPRKFPPLICNDSQGRFDWPQRSVT